MMRTAGVLQNTETAYPSRTPEWIRVEDLFLAFCIWLIFVQFLYLRLCILIDPLVSLTCYYIKHAHFGLVYAISNTHIVNIHMKSCKMMALNHN